MNTADIDRATIVDKRATADSLIFQAWRLRREAMQIEYNLLKSSPADFAAKYAFTMIADHFVIQSPEANKAWHDKHQPQLTVHDGAIMMITGSITGLNTPINNLKVGGFSINDAGGGP